MISGLRSCARMVAISAALTLLVAGTSRAQALQLIGTWTLNMTKSSLGGPAPQKQTVTFRTAGVDVLTGAEDTIYADGSHTTIMYTAKMDGRDYPITGAPAILARTDTISLKRLSATTVVWTYKKGPTIVLSLPGTISTDGHVLTMTAAGGQVVLVYERS
jgi:hypothetical protein